MYLEKKMPDLPYVGTGDGYAPGIWNKESVSTLSLDPQNLLDVNWEHKDVDFLLPFATQFFDMRIKGNNSCQWNEEFIINEYAQNILQNNVVILFEMLEMNPSMIYNRDPKLNSENLYPICWAYLRPLGSAHIHLTKSRLQLFKFKYKHDKKSKESRAYDQRTPDVFLDFNFPVREKYLSFLEVELQFVSKSKQEIPRLHYSRAPWEKEATKEQFTLDLEPKPLDQMKPDPTLT